VTSLIIYIDSPLETIKVCNTNGEISRKPPLSHDKSSCRHDILIMLSANHKKEVANRAPNKLTVMTHKKPLLVALGGPSSSGKTTVAKTLHALIEDSFLLHLDDFYLPDKQIPLDPATGVQNWDCVEAIDFDRFKKYIHQIKIGEELPKKIESLEGDVSLTLSTSEMSQVKASIVDSNLDDFQLVFIDGFMLFHDPSLFSLFDINLFYYASFETLKVRRESRAGYNTVDGFWVDPPHYFEQIVWPAYEESHKYLFEGHDINAGLDSEVTESLGIQAIKNESGLGLYDLVSSSLKVIIDRVM